MRKNRLVQCLALGWVAFCASLAANADFTAATIPSDGVYKFTFGVETTTDGSFAVPASAIYDVQGTDYYDDTDSATFSYGFLGTTETSYLTDVPVLPSCAEPRAIDGFKVVKGQQIVLHDATDKNNLSCVKGPAKSEYLPEGASEYEGRYPVRFAMRGEERAYYAVTCTVANASSEANADVTLFSERCHIIAHHLSLAPGETKTFAWSVELAPNVYKSLTPNTYYDNAINVCVVGENAALASLTVVKQPQTSGTVRGSAVDNMNVGKTMWLCTDSTGTDQNNATPFFSLQNYSGVGSGLSRWAPANLSIRNQGEGGLAANDNAHRKSCLLKPGDYLYVEYGHNHKSDGPSGYKACLDTYLDDANTAGAYLLIVSPVERRSSWNSETSTWNRSLQGFAEAGQEWVEEKIAAGSTNVAYIALNERYSTWMNEEIHRVTNINSNVSLQNAINFYYQSTKGSSIDVSHINNAGTDQAAYWVWYDALQTVAAGEADGATESEKIQAAVLKGITEGYQGVVGIDEGSTAENTPWYVTDEIINAGAAPNSFWDTPVTAGYDYANDVAVADVAASTNADGTVTISGVTMRVLNAGNYFKAVIEVYDADDSVTGRYYSFYNYDASGSASGDFVTPEKTGFLETDKAMSGDGASADCETLTIPAGGKALVWFAVADGTTWQVGDNEPCSAKYPIEAWTAVLVDDACTDASVWGKVTKAVYTFAVPDGEDYLSYYSTAKDSSGYWSTCGIYRDFDNGGEISSGRYRVSFKTLYNDGNITFCVGSSHGSAGNPGTPLSGALPLVQLYNAAATVLGSSAAGITLSADETPVVQNIINPEQWLDVDMIVDMALGKASVSIGGSDYQEYTIDAYADDTAIEGLPYKYFGFNLATYATTDGAIDDLKVLQLSPSPTFTVKANVNDGSFGYVTINGKALSEREVPKGKDVALTAVSSDADVYKFICWEDADGNEVSTNPTFVIEDLSADIDYTAVFAEYGDSEDRVVNWDFSGYVGDFALSATTSTTVEENGMTFSLQSGDSMTADSGLYWDGVTSGNPSSDRYIEFTPISSGRMTVVFSVGGTAIGSNGKPVTPSMIASTNGTQVASYSSTDADVDYTFSFDVVAGETYKLTTYYYYRTTSISVKSIKYSYSPVYYTATAAVAEASTGLGTASVNGGESATLISGKTATFIAAPVSGAYKFTGWTDAEGVTNSTDATYTLAISADTELYANFEARTDGDEYTAEVDWTPFSGNAGVSSSDSAWQCAVGDLEIHGAKGDTLTGDGIYWAGPGTTKSDTTKNTSNRYIKFDCTVSGTLTLTFMGDTTDGSNYARIYLSDGTDDGVDAMYKSNSANKAKDASAVNTLTEASFTVEAGKTYYIWPYFYNKSAAKFWITDISYPGKFESAKLTLVAGEGGTVAINGVSGAGEYTVQKGEYVQLTAMPEAYYGLSAWTEDDGATTNSTDETFWYCVTDDATVTANFLSEDYIDITRTCDFSVFDGDNEIADMNEPWDQLVGRMEVHGATNDTLTASGIYWAGPGTTKSDWTQNKSGRYIKFECVRDGSLSFTFKSDGKNGSNYGRMYCTIETNDIGIACMSKTNADKNGWNVTATGTDVLTTCSHDVTAGETYYIWPYMFGQNTAQFWVTSISYTSAKSDYSTLTINIDGTETTTNLYYGSSIALEAPDVISTRVFTGWYEGDTYYTILPETFYTLTNAVTLTARYRDVDTHAFTWNWAVKEGNWNDASNWYYEGRVKATTYPSTTNDYATFNTAATVNLTGNAAVKEAWLNEAVTFTNGTLTAALVTNYEDEGKAILANAGFTGAASGNAAISNDVVMVAGTTNSFNVSTGGSMTIAGNISGEGCYKITFPNAKEYDCYLSGNNNEFYGDVYTSGGSSYRNCLRWSNSNAAGTNTYWHVAHSYDTYNADASRMGGDVKFGGYDGPWWDRYDGAVLTIGYLNRDSSVSIYNAVSGRANSVVKVGSANLTLGTKLIKDLTINEGSVTMPAGIVPSTLTMAEGTTIYISGDEEWTAGTITNLFSYTTLSGVDADALTNMVSVTGLADNLAADISVADGVVTATISSTAVAPTTDDDSATVTENEDGSYTIELSDDAKTVVITVPEGVTVSEVVVSTNTTTVTGVPDDATLKVAVAWDGGTANYAIVAVNSETGAVSLDEDATVTVGDEDIPLKPVLADTGDDAVEPFEPSNDDGEVEVGVKSIPGLVYTLKRGTEPTAIDCTASGDDASVKATSSRVSLKDAEPPNGKAFYTISVDVR